MRRSHRYLSTLVAAIVSLSLLLFVAAGTAFAHAKVLSATPGIGSTIATAPTTVTVITAENINPDPKLSNLFVYAPNGDLISQGDAKVSLNNPKEMSITIKPSGDGIYVVRWITVSAEDGDPDQGAFVFTVKAGATGTTASSTGNAPATTAGTPSSTSSSATSATNNSSSPVLPAVIAAIVALLVGLGAGFGLGRRGAAARAAGDAVPVSEREKTPTQNP
jgi:methionine-rich copper-binding protein CopC